MNKVFQVFSSILVIILCITPNLLGQSIEQRLVVVQNDQILGGNFRVQVQVKGTSLPVANTLGSATIDVQFNNTHLQYGSATLWAFASAQGYARTATNNTTSIRVGVIGSTVNADGGGSPAGFDIGTNFTSWVQLNFTILDAAITTSLTINNITNSIGVFENHSNEPFTAVINNQTLTAPENITNIALPVELTSFAAQMYDQNKVKLNWETKTEVNNYGFNVERQINNGEWNNIGFVEGNGNSSAPKEYSFTDKNVVGGSKFYYRLKQIDNDGRYEYSDAVEVEIVPNEYSLSQNYPNPFNPSTKIRYQLPQESKVVIKIYNILGSEVIELLNEQKEAGVYEVEFNANNLSSGTYIYKVSADNFVQTRKMVLLK